MPAGVRGPGVDDRGDDTVNWWIEDHDTGQTVRGPYRTSETAVEVRREMERYTYNQNLWVVQRPGR